MKDFINTELAVDDYVVFTEPGYRNLVIGKIFKITPQKINLEYKTSQGYHAMHRCDSNNVMKVDNIDVLALILKGT